MDRSGLERDSKLPRIHLTGQIVQSKEIIGDPHMCDTLLCDAEPIPSSTAVRPVRLRRRNRAALETWRPPPFARATAGRSRGATRATGASGHSGRTTTPPVATKHLRRFRPWAERRHQPVATGARGLGRSTPLYRDSAGQGLPVSSSGSRRRASSGSDGQAPTRHDAAF